MTFNEAITYWTDVTLKDFFDNRFFSSNGCPIRATHFVSHASTDYSLVGNFGQKSQSAIVKVRASGLGFDSSDNQMYFSSLSYREIGKTDPDDYMT